MKDEVMADAKWEFNAQVTEVFDDMLARSIPDYEGMRRITTELATRFAQEGTSIVDLGCSRGAALKPIMKALENLDVRYMGLEISDPMFEAAKKEIPTADVRKFDLREGYPKVISSVTLSILTLQFIPIEYRQRIIQDVYDSLTPNGIFIFVEKILGADSYADNVFVNTYLNRKGNNGYTQEQINNKRKALEGVLVPVTDKWNKELLTDAGFKHVDCYWRHLNFAGWFGVK
jgi:tRNA (cmo5U34)-methyltransferase